MLSWLVLKLYPLCRFPDQAKCTLIYIFNNVHRKLVRWLMIINNVQHRSHEGSYCHARHAQRLWEHNWQFDSSLNAIILLTPNLSPLARKFTTAPLTLDACTCTGVVHQASNSGSTSACSPIIKMRISSQWVSRISTRCCLGKGHMSIKKPETHLSELMIHLPPAPFFSSSQSGKIPSWGNF